MRFVSVFAVCLWLGLTVTGPIQAAESAHGLAMHGDLKYPADFTHFDYVNPDAPKGGLVRLAGQGGFDTLNPFTIKGASAMGLLLTYDTLLMQSKDEPFSGYGLLAESVDFSDDRSEITFTLRSEAVWSDGVPITADDVVYSLETLRTKGLPFYNSYYGDVERVEALAPNRVRFDLKNPENRELPLIIGTQMPILPKHYWEGRDFSAVTLDIPVSSGPYAIDHFDPGRSITFKRRADWWAAKVPAVQGYYNFGSIQYIYYRDATVMLEAFKSGAYDYRVENVARQWATGYDTPALKDGRYVLDRFPHHRVAGMQGFAFNTRRVQFSDPRVREALAYTFNFTWTNKTLFFGEYERLRSYFDNSELAATGLPSPAELEILEPLRGQIPDRVFTESYTPPDVSEEKDALRNNLGRAMELLNAAGWQIKDGALRNAEGQAFTFEILLVQPEFDRIVLPMVRNMERLGIKASIRSVDTAQYIKRVQDFDFDMIVDAWGQTESPGNEQRDFWSSLAADTKASRNSTGIKSEAIDHLVELVITSQTREDLVTRVRALDRVLQWSFLVIPQYYVAADRIAHWNIFGYPDVTPDKGQDFQTWWIDPERAARLGRRE